MHLNYYFLSQLVRTLGNKLIGSILFSAFSQNKDELLLNFQNSAKEEFYIKATLSSSFTCLSFPPEFHRAKKNSVDLFNQLIGLKVLSLYQYRNERAFSIQFEDNYLMVFKMYGNRSNIILFGSSGFCEMFNNRLKSDSGLKLPLDRDLQTNEQDFISKPDLHKWFPTLRGLPEIYLDSKGYNELSATAKWSVIQETITTLQEMENFAITDIKGKLHLSGLPFEGAQDLEGDILDASNAFYRQYISTESLKKGQEKLLNSIRREIGQSRNYITKTSKKLSDIQKGRNYQQLGDLLMANLHAIQPHKSSVTLHNFYTNEEISINLKPNLSPQKNAEIYYRKAKNQHLEIKSLEENLKVRKKSLTELEELELKVLEAKKVSDIKALTKDKGVNLKGSKDKIVLPYHEREIRKFRILIGKNARSNDKLLNSYTWKEDLWLHVKDAPGSHVIIKYQAGKDYNAPLIEIAAQLAAYHSKRKSESLVPVSYTPRKYVRKRKGDPAGMVVVEKEKVILVEPKG